MGINIPNTPRMEVRAMSLKAIRKVIVEGDLVRVPLTKGYEAIVDLSDISIVEAFNWHAVVGPRTVYAQRFCRISTERCTQLAMARVLISAPSGLHVDHINGNGLDNRRANLRLATVSQNQHNAQLRRDNSSGFKGVYFCKHRRKWRVAIKFLGRTISLGDYSCIKAAAAAYANASAKYHGEFGRVS